MIIFYNSEEDISFLESNPCQSAVIPSDVTMLSTQIQDKPNKSSKPRKRKQQETKLRQPTRIQPKRK